MGSDVDLKLTFQDEHGRSMAEKIEGIGMTIENSHPHILSANFDYYNSTLNLIANRMGEVNIVVRYNGDAFDVIKVSVLSSILPLSPI